MIWEQSAEIPKISGSQNVLLVYGSSNPADLNRANAILSKDEIAFANRLKSDNYKSLWISCHITLKLMLGDWLDINPLEIPLTKNGFGKPLLVNSNLFFNLSHTNDSYLLGFCLGGRIGVDLEKLSGREDLATLIDYAFSTDEAKYCSEGETSLRFLEIWTLKEAYLKATGVGLLDNLASINVHGYSNNDIFNRQFSKETFECPNGESASIVYRNGRSINYVWVR